MKAKTLLEAARAYAAGCEAVTVLTREVNAIHCAESEDSDEYGPGRTCVDRFTAFEEHGDYPGQCQQEISVPWWQATEAQLSGICDQCKERVRVWRARHVARKSIAGLKTAFIRAYRREVSA